MTRGLLTLLAMAAPHAVPAERVLEALWPNVDPGKSRPRLRTAASQVRKAMGTSCIEREGDGLVLRHVWVDTQHFEALVGQARREFILGRTESGLHLAEDALALYTDDLFDDGTTNDWIVPRRAHFRRLLGDLLIETAEAALSKGWARAAVSAAGRVTAMDSADERACRVLMRGHQVLGETGASLLAFDRCKAALVEALGVDPSLETYHLQRTLLRARHQQAAPPSFVGRSDTMEALTSEANEAFGNHRARVTYLSGPPGSGKSRVLDELGMHLGIRTVLIRLGNEAAPSGEGLIARIGTSMGIRGGPTEVAAALTMLDQPTLVCLDDAWWTGPDSLDALVRTFNSAEAPLFVVVATASPRVGDHRTVGMHRLRTLDRADVATLLADVLGTHVAPALVDHLIEQANGLPGPLIDEARRMQEGGLLADSPDGLTRDVDSVLMDVGASAASRVEAARCMLPLAALDVLDLLAVLHEPIGAAELDRLNIGSGPVGGWLDVLHDAGLLERDEDRYRFAAEELRDAAYRWMRPSVRRTLHQRLATVPAATLPHETRLRHWVAAGSHQAGTGSTLDPLGSAAIALLPQSPLRLAVALGAIGDTALATEKIQSLVTISTAARQREDAGTAERASNLAMALATSQLPECLPELYRRRARLMIPGEDSLSWCDRARLAVKPGDSLERSQIESVAGRLLDRWSQPQSVVAHHEAVRLADASHNVRQQVRSRSLLVGQLIAGRQMAEADVVALASADIADRSDDDVLRATSLHAIARAALWTWTSSRYIHTLERAWPLSRPDPRVHASIALGLARALHDFGREGVDDALRLARQICTDTPLEPTWHLTAAYIALERGRLQRSADHLAKALADRTWSALAYSWAHLLKGRLLVAQGMVPEAASQFALVLQIAGSSGASLLFGEAAGRLAMARAPTDPAAADSVLSLATHTVGAGQFPREQSLLLLARAHVALAHGRPEVALVLARTSQKAAREAKTRVAESQMCITRCLDHPLMSERVIDITDSATRPGSRTSSDGVDQATAQPTPWVSTMWKMMNGPDTGGPDTTAQADLRTG